MSRYITLFISLLLAPIVSAGVLDNYSRATLHANTNSAHRAKAASDKTEYYALLIEINSDEAISLLQDAGAVIFHRRENFVLAAVPKSAIDVLDNSEFIDIATLAKKTCCTNDVARDFANVTAAHTGTETMSGYDGTGVVAGICDIGFDPNHIAFKDRLSMMSVYDEASAKRDVYAPGSALQTQAEYPQTDTSENLHATHTTNIMAGARENNPYYGAAPGANLAVSTSSLTEMGLLCGIEDIIAYAKELGKPAVINLSVGSYIGPHDGTDIVNRYLDLVGQEAVICFSAGNNGESKYCLQHDFTAAAPTVGSMIESTSWTGFDITGAMDFWSADSRDFQLQLVAYDVIDKKFIYESEWFGAGDEGSFVLEEGVDATWDEAFTDSYIAVAYGMDSHNSRYNITIAYKLNPTEEQPGHHWARYICGWRIKAAPGVHLDAYTDGGSSFFRAYGVSGMSDGNSVNSISNLCCGHNIISVGSCNSRATTPLLDGEETTYDFAVGSVSAYSSCGVTLDGRTMPQVCAPGNMVVSATSSPYRDANPDKITEAYSETVDGKTYYWHAECGTSMSSPLAAGIIALWLQADPTLTVDQVKQIISATAQTNYTDIADERWGAGCIDAYAGLKYILDKGNVDNLDVPDAITIIGHRIYSATPITIYTLQGRQCVANADLAPGIYVVHTSTSTLKVHIK